MPAGTNTEDGHPVFQVFARSAATAGPATNQAARRMQIRDLLIKNGADYDIISATMLGDLDRVRKLLAADKSLAQARDVDGQTPLHWAVTNNQPALITFWLQAGADTAATNQAGQTPLHLAAEHGLVEPVKLLLAAAAPAGVRDTNGWTPLDVAIHAQQPETIRLLLNGQTGAAHPERGVGTALHDAAAKGNIPVLAMLLETETNLDARNELGLTPLQVAVQNGHLAAAALLVDKGAKVDVRDPDGNTLFNQVLLLNRPYLVYDRPPIPWLDRLGADPRKSTFVKYLTVGRNEQGPNPVLQVASFLLACGVDPRTANQAGQTPLQLVTGENLLRGIFLFDDDREALLKLLGSGGGSLNDRDAEGNTALHQVAAQYDSYAPDKVVQLVAGGAEVNATNHQGQTPLHVAADHINSWPSEPGGPDNAFLALIKAKANVNAQDNQGLTPLHVLAASESSFKKEAFQALLAAGANPNLRDHQGRTPALVLLSGKWPWEDAGDCVALLVTAGADLSAQDNQGKTLLHAAALGDQKPLFFVRGVGDALAAARLQVDARDHDGDTPLQIAAKTGTWDVYDWLVKQGANLDVTNQAGETPRLLAVRSQDPFRSLARTNPDSDFSTAIQTGNLEALRRLVQALPQLVNESNQFRLAPLRLAVLKHRTDMIELLETNGAKWDEGSAVLAGRTNELAAILRQNPAAAATVVDGQGLAHLAAANGEVNTLNLLIAAGADLQAQDQWGLSPLGRALINHQAEVAVLLRQQGGRENLFDAVYAGELKTAMALLAQDKSLAASENKMGASAVAVAAAAGRTDILKLLLKNGAPVDATGPEGGKNPMGSRSPLHLAAFFNQTNAVKILTQAGATVNLTDRRGFTALHWAVMEGATEPAAWLLSHKAAVNQAVTRPDLGRAYGPGPGLGMNGIGFQTIGETPLHLAVFRGQTNLVKLLLKVGADANALNAQGLTPLDLTDRQQFLMGLDVMTENGMRTLLEPLGVSQSSPRNLDGRKEQNAVAAQLIKAAGGKHADRLPETNGRPAGIGN